MGVKRFYTIVSRVTSVVSDTKNSEWKCEFIMDNEKIGGGLYLIEVDNSSSCLSYFIVESTRFYEQDLFNIICKLRNVGGKFTFG